MCVHACSSIRFFCQMQSLFLACGSQLLEAFVLGFWMLVPIVVTVAAVLCSLQWFSDRVCATLLTSNVGTQTDQEAEAVRSEPLVNSHNVGTQSQCTYARHRATPRFLPLAEVAHGAWHGND